MDNQSSHNVKKLENKNTVCTQDLINLKYIMAFDIVPEYLTSVCQKEA